MSGGERSQKSSELEPATRQIERLGRQVQRAKQGGLAAEKYDDAGRKSPGVRLQGISYVRSEAEAVRLLREVSCQGRRP